MKPAYLMGVLLLLAWSQTTFAQTVTGTVTDSFGTGLAGIDVNFEPAGITVVTGVAGAFIASVPLGSFEMEIDPGLPYAPERLLGTAVSGTTSMGTVALQPGFLLSGVVMQTGGLPAVGADINVYDSVSGAKLYTPGDNTDTAGAWSVEVPAGFYRVRAAPAAGTPYAAVEVDNISVAGATVVPTLVLPPGVVLSGTVTQASNGQPVAGADIDVLDSVTGARIPTPNDDTDGAGNFAISVPLGTYILRVEPTPGVALQGLETGPIVVNGATNAGVLSLLSGAILTGLVTDGAGTPVPQTDLDVDTSLGGLRLFTANDKTDATGNFSIVVPFQTLDITVVPPSGSSLVGERRINQVITGNMTLATFLLAQGVMITGTVTSPHGPEGQAELRFVHPTTGARPVVGNNITAANGTYQLFAPLGTWDLVVETQKLTLAADGFVPGVAITGASTLNIPLSSKQMACYVAPAGPTVISNGGSLTIAAAALNPTPTVQSNNLEVVIIAPDGVETLLFPSTPGMWPAGHFWYNLAAVVPLPSVNPAHLGFPFQIRARFVDPITNIVYDSDGFEFVIL